MKISKLKEILKPLIIECVKEVIFETGTVSHIVSEVAVGLKSQELISENSDKKTSRYNELRNEMLTKVQRNAYEDINVGKIKQPSKVEKIKKNINNFNGMDIFEGTTSLEEDERKANKGADISFLEGVSKNWGKLI